MAALHNPQSSHPAIDAVTRYLNQRDCQIEKITPTNMIEFRLPGETSLSPGGRISMARDGSLKMWHRYAEKGLAAGEPWQPGGAIKLGEKSTPALSAHVHDLEKTTHLAPLFKVPKFSEPAQLKTYHPEQVRLAADAALQSVGLIPSRVKDRYCDPADNKPVIKLLVSDEGLATVFSFRDDIQLPPPWRDGRISRDGQKTMFATGKDLGLDGSAIATTRLPNLAVGAHNIEQNPINIDLNRDTYCAWNAGVLPPAEHRHLIKSKAVLKGDDLRIYPPKHTFAGTMMAPMFRPDPSGALDKVQLCGVQHLMPQMAFDNSTDKIMAKGSITSGAFVPVPCPAALIHTIGKDALAPLDAWLQVADKSKPLVICEGIATGLAIHQSDAGNALCTLSSSNTMSVASWVKKSGLAEYFPSVAIATDHDISRNQSTGKLKSNAIPRAVEAAKENGFALAVPPKSSKAGADARDLLGEGGEQAVRDFIQSAVSPETVEKLRPEIFLPGKASPIKESDLEL